MGEDKYDSSLWTCQARTQDLRQGPLWPLENDNLHRRLRHEGIIAPFVIDGPIDGASFLDYVVKVLVPELKPDDIVVLDNLSSHKSEAVKAAIEAAGATLMFLPPYSPDLNPIELMFSKLRTCFVKPQSAPSKLFGIVSVNSSTASHRKNAPTSCAMPGIAKPERKMS